MGGIPNSIPSSSFLFSLPTSPTSRSVAGRGSTIRGLRICLVAPTAAGEGDVQTSVRHPEHTQSLKTCEGFPRVGSSPTPGNLESVSYAIQLSPEKPKIRQL